ncbi:MAG: type II toxin-antitoxin system HigB family toxin [Spirochaetes bacterium]|nr:type II toxin-antitoxin system HigB family toxin [Spirochaetota bacterium]
MNVISKKAIVDFIKKHPVSKSSLESWYYETCHDNWKTTMDIKKKYPTASFLKDNMVIFNISGNKYRLVVKLAYHTQRVFIKWIGTHSEYDKKIF